MTGAKMHRSTSFAGGPKLRMQNQFRPMTLGKMVTAAYRDLQSNDNWMELFMNFGRSTFDFKIVFVCNCALPNCHVFWPEEDRSKTRQLHLGSSRTAVRLAPRREPWRVDADGDWQWSLAT